MSLKLKNVCREVDRHQTVRYYYRKKPGPRIVLKGEFGSDEFLQSYQDAKAGLLRPAPRFTTAKLAEVRKNTLRWLCMTYFESANFRLLGKDTQRVRRQILEHCLEEPVEPGSEVLFSEFPLERLSPKAIKALRDRKLDLPEAANGRVKALRQVFAFAVEEEGENGDSLMERNPAKDVGYLDSNNPDGFHSWSIEEVRQYEAKHPIGTKARLALALLLFTMQRRSDVILFGKQHVRINPDPQEDEFERTLVFTQFKGRKRNPVTLDVPVIPHLWEIVEKSPIGDLTFLVTAFGRGFTSAGFGNKMRQWCDEAKLPQCSAHGLRKAGLSVLAELGCSTKQIMSISGHQTEKEVTRYTRSADQKKLATAAMTKLARNRA
ncbi:site-specific integrase [Aminobacter carboxidus]|uniref:site-specific integrase n=1 Tax=Aminobacter carboxidus TaxID=376165 RepID=UPI0031B62341